MTRICPALVILTLVAPALFADEPKPARRKHEFYRPRLETMRKNLPLKKVKALRADAADVHQLTAVEADMLIPEGTGNRKVRLYSYNSQPVGPTIVTTPGATLKIRVTNNLVPKPDEPPVPGVNDFHGFNVTNLHTHGLNVTPRDPGDNVFREIRQNFSHLFRYELAADQVPGTYFYHPHKHGSVGYQVACGMVGALIVKDETKGLDSLPELRKAADDVLVLQQLDMHQNTPGDTLYTLTPTQFYKLDRNIVTAINGQIAPLLTLKKKEVARWRFVHAGVEEAIGLTIDKDPDHPPAGDLPQMYQIAWDGIPLGTLAPPADSSGKPDPLWMYPGNRADVLVQAPDAAGMFLLKSAEVPKNRSLRNTAQQPVPLAFIKVEGDADDSIQTQLPDPKAVADKANAVMPPDLSTADVSVRRTFSFQSDDQDVVFEINGTAFDPAKVTTVLLKDACEEWTLKAIDGPHHSAPGHPFHVHVNPFQVLRVDGAPVKPYWSDTIFIPVGHCVTVRTKFKNFTGKTVLHCHILDHEDAGMMHGIFIEDPGVGSPGRGGNAGGVESPVPPLGLSTANGKLDLAGASGTTVLVFFQGATCPSCLRQLKSFVEARRSWGDGKVRLVAVSSDTIADRGRLGHLLGVRAADPVEVCEDRKLSAFKKMGCEDDGPLHGTFVIEDGKVIWRRVGFTPFANVEVLAGLLATRGGKAGRASSP